MSDPRLPVWLDKLEITEIVMKLARGIDRCDAALLETLFWPDASDDHGLFSGSARDFIGWVIPLLQTMERTQHLIGNVLVEVNGTRAFSESYFMAYHRTREGGEEQDMIAAGRYLDRFEKRGAEWRIHHRQAVYDWTVTEKPRDSAWKTAPLIDLLERGTRGGADRSYRDRNGWLAAQ